LILCATALGISAAPAGATRPFTRAFADDTFSQPGWIPRAVHAGAHMVLLDLTWSNVEPNAPAPGTDPTSPSDPQYDFSPVDAAVRSFAATGISVAILVSEAPSWAEAPGGPTNLEVDGSWRPSATAYGQLATALAGRYSGSYPDPLNPGSTLPRVRYFQAWAEANLERHLAPQWTSTGGSWIPAGPGIYRSLLNAFYAGIKRAHPDNVVITSGFGPYGDSPGACNSSQLVGPGCRIPPAAFVRELLCLHGRALTLEACANPAHFDALAIDPYEVSSPTTPAVNADDIAAPDLGKLTRILNRAVPLGRALPRGRKQLWVTEFSYESNPPNPTAVSLATQARWLEESFYVFWSERVSTAAWYLIRDEGGTDYANSYYSGIFYFNGTPKPSFQAYRFPLVVMPSGHSAIVWGMAPLTGRVAVQLQHGSSWKTLFATTVAAGSVFERKISAKLRGNFRASVGGESSLVWKR
jgi:hypothetical protein